MVEDENHRNPSYMVNLYLTKATQKREREKKSFKSPKALFA